jgi:hypothetical protein
MLNLEPFITAITVFGINFMEDITDIKERLVKIEERNLRVEADKKWETSFVRRISVAALTYLIICLYMYITGESQLFLKALVPVLGFILATFSLRFIRKLVGY